MMFVMLIKRQSFSSVIFFTVEKDCAVILKQCYRTWVSKAKMSLISLIVTAYSSSSPPAETINYFPGEHVYADLLQILLTRQGLL